MSRNQYLSFNVGNEVYGIGILGIKEIIEFGGLTVVPLMPACARGVINLRGAVVPIMDLAARFGKPPSVITRRSCIVIVEVSHDTESPHQVLGVIVDAVNGVLDIPDFDVAKAPDFGVRIRPDFIAGMGKLGEQFVILLDLNNVLSVEEIAGMADAVTELERVAA